MKKKLLTMILPICAMVVSARALVFAVVLSKGAGEDGKSAYEIWLENGHTGTEEDFLDWLREDESAEVGTPGLHYQRISGQSAYRVIGIGLAAETDIVIPSSYNGLPVTEIGSSAFSGQSYIERVVIPDSVTSIGASAFFSCSSLKSINIPDGVTSIGNSAFPDYGEFYTIEGNCRYLGNSNNPYLYLAGMLSTDATTATIRSGCRFIRNHAFSYCYNTTIYCERASKPSSWSSDWNESNCPVVWDCKNNEVATDGNIYTTIGGIRYALKDGEAAVAVQPVNITSANISANVTYKGVSYLVTSIESRAFSGCEMLTGVIIPDSVTRIGSLAFENCSRLEGIVIPDSVTSVGKDAFSGCTSLDTIYCEAISRPSGWNYDWCGNYSSVVWGYTGD